MSDDVLKGARVLLLEDDSFINLATNDLLEEMGCRVISFMRLEPAMAAEGIETLDAAVLDVNIHGQSSYELADRLHKKGVPIVFLTGYASPARTDKWNSFPHCFKPCDPVELRALLVKALTTRRGHGVTT